MGETGDGSVVYVGTFSKVLYPSLRLGYAVLPPDMAPRFAAAKALADHHSSTVEQVALAAFVGEGHFERHLARMRRLYAARQAALVAALAAELPVIARRDPAVGAAGLHLLVGFEGVGSEQALLARAAAVGVGLDGAAPCYLVDSPPRPSVLLGYASVPEERIREGVAALARTLAPKGANASA
jgi:GntR family transcriptional regulator/MocR family aminotransferase